MVHGTIKKMIERTTLISGVEGSNAPRLLFADTLSSQDNCLSQSTEDVLKCLQFLYLYSMDDLTDGRSELG